VVLAATDPANPYGATLPWPKADAGRLQRSAGVHVVLVDGSLVASIRAGEGEIATFLAAEEPSRARAAAALASALARWSAAGRSAVTWVSVDGEPLVRSGLAPFLREAGFVPAGPGMRINPMHAEAAEERAEAAESEAEPEEDESTEAGS
jgi:ATP-dependent helicase Lhr and Lhr-like helicase